MSTREKILESATRLLQTRAYHGFSFQDIADEVGIRKPSLYHHFSSKDKIAMAILHRSKDVILNELEKVQGKSPVEQLHTYFALFRMVQAGGQRMCPGGSFAATWDAVSPELQSEVRKFIRFHLDWLEENLEAGKDAGEYLFACSAKVQAQFITSCIQGAITTARLTGNSRIFDNVMDNLKASIIIKSH